MKKFVSRGFIVAMAILVVTTLAGLSFAQQSAGKDPMACWEKGEKRVRFGTGDAKGTFGAMFRNMLEYLPEICEYRDQITGESSTGGLMNVDLLTKRKIEVGMVPEDVLELTKRTNDLVPKFLRTLATLHYNSLHIIVTAVGTKVKSVGVISQYNPFDSNQPIFIKDLRDLRDRPVAVFASALGTVTLINERLKLNLIPIKVDSWKDGLKLLREGEVFAFMTTGGWPIPWVETLDPKLYTLANVESAEIANMQSPFKPVRLNYEKLGKLGVTSFGARVALMTWDYTSASRIDQLLSLRERLTEMLQDIKESENPHPSWTDVEKLDDYTWPKYDPKPIRKTASHRPTASSQELDDEEPAPAKPEPSPTPAVTKKKK